MKDLPRVFPGKVKEDLQNTQNIFYGNERGDVKKLDSLTLIKKINSIFADTSHVYKSKVKITLEKETVEKVIVGKNSTSLITIDGELIRIMDIYNIEKI